MKTYTFLNYWMTHTSFKEAFIQNTFLTISFLFWEAKEQAVSDISSKLHPSPQRV